MNFKNKNPFKILGIKTQFYTETELKKAYMLALKQANPQTNPNSFKIIRKAYEQIRQSMSVYGTQYLNGFICEEKKTLNKLYAYIEGKSKSISNRKKELALASIKKNVIDIKHNNCKKS